jgi:hypothetical protein
MPRTSREAIPPASDLERAYGAVETLYHAYLTGLILAAITRLGTPTATELVFRTFRRQHLEKFLPGLEKLGLRKLPHAVAAAQYHYLSNALGGVKVEYMYESDRKAWVRYPPPRWIWEGTAVCAIPSEVSRAMLRGWHGHNGVSLGNPRLGFVCTKQTVDGQPGLEGYYQEFDRDLEPEERVRFAPGEDAPDFDPSQAPKAEGPAWPRERLLKVARNYAMDYIRSLLPELLALVGPVVGGQLAELAGRQIGMQFYDATARTLGIAGSSAADFARYLSAMSRGQGDAPEWAVEDDQARVWQPGWRLMDGLQLPLQAFDAWTGLWRGALAVHNRRLMLEVRQRRDAGDPCWEWVVRSSRVRVG